MLFVQEIVVPKNTTRDAPVITELFMASGIITWYSIVFPPGCKGLVHCAIYHQAHQIVPSKVSSTRVNPGVLPAVYQVRDLSGDRFPIEWTDYYELYGVPYMLEARCWSEDDTYPHTITIRIAVLPRKAIIALAVVDAIKSVFGVLSPSKLIAQGKKIIHME